ncbi:zf-RVT domain-containing protein, partial [Cephalotus follicularis]
VCKPMAEEGLGVKDFKTWNRALFLKQVWDIVINQSLWARWCHVYLIKQSNFWCLPTNGLHSWSWRQILLLRPLAKEHLIYKCGRGDKFSLWFDPWMHGESVHTLYGHRVIHDSLLGRLALVKEVIKEGSDKLLAWGAINSASCVFNCGEVESLEHLFFHCPFSHYIWRAVLSMCNILRPISQWREEVQWMLDHARGHKFSALVRKLAFAASAYHIWLERN